MDILYNIGWHFSIIGSMALEGFLHNFPALWGPGCGFAFVAVAIWGWRKKQNSDQVASGSQRALLSNIPTYQSMLPYMTFELTRGRRYNHNLSMLILGLDHSQKQELLNNNRSDSNQWGNEQLASKFLFSLIGTILREGLRDSDILSCEILNDRFIVQLTDTDNAKAIRAVARLNAMVYDQVNTRLRAGIAEFPSNGLTIEDLLKYAEMRFYHHAAKAEAAPAGCHDGYRTQKVENGISRADRDAVVSEKH